MAGLAAKRQLGSCQKAVWRPPDGWGSRCAVLGMLWCCSGVALGGSGPASGLPLCCSKQQPPTNPGAAPEQPKNNTRATREPQRLPRRQPNQLFGCCPAATNEAAQPPPIPIPPSTHALLQAAAPRTTREQAQSGPIAALEQHKGVGLRAAQKQSSPRAAPEQSQSSPKAVPEQPQSNPRAAQRSPRATKDQQIVSQGAARQ